MDLSIIIVNYNTKKLTENCINSVIRNSQNLSYEIILVDNASEDSSYEYLQELFPNLKIIANTENLGFAKANNQGIKEAKGKSILLLNSDTEFVEDCLSLLLKFLNNTTFAGIVGCKVLNTDQTLQESVYHFPTIWSELVFFTKVIIKNFWDPITYFHKMKYWGHNVIREVDCVSGCFMLIKNEIFSKIGYLDEKFFMYYEDAEFCKRLKSNTNYKVFYHPGTKIVHLQGKSIKVISFETLKECLKSAIFYFTKVNGRKTGLAFLCLCKFIWLIEMLLFLPFIFINVFRKKLNMIGELVKIHAAIN